MAKAALDDPILTRFCAVLNDVFGVRLEQVVLFGSRARGDARPDSDYDIAVFLREMPDRWRELDKLAELRTKFFDETGAFIVALPYLSGARADASPLMHEIRRDGLLL